MKAFDSLELLPIREQDLSLEKFRNTLAHDSSNIDRSFFVPPKLGSNSFGKIHVVYKSPIYTKLGHE